LQYEYFFILLIGYKGLGMSISRVAPTAIYAL